MNKNEQRIIDRTRSLLIHHVDGMLLQDIKKNIELPYYYIENQDEVERVLDIYSARKDSDIECTSKEGDKFYQYKETRPFTIF